MGWEKPVQILQMAFRVFQSNPLALRRNGLPTNKTKFMQMLDSETYRALEREADGRGASIQELLRTVIIPDWLIENRKPAGSKLSRS